MKLSGLKCENHADRLVRTGLALSASLIQLSVFTFLLPNNCYASTAKADAQQAKGAKKTSGNGTSDSQSVMPPPPSPDPARQLQPLSPQLAPTAPASVQPSEETAKPAVSDSSTAKKSPAAKAANNKPTATAKAGAGSKADGKKPVTATAAPAQAPDGEKYPDVAKLEELMFGSAKPNIPLEYRLDRLESETFHLTNPEWEPKQRISRLTQTLIGGTSATVGAPVPASVAPWQVPSAVPSDSNSYPNYAPLAPAPLPQLGADSGPFSADPLSPNTVAGSTGSFDYFLPSAAEMSSAEFQKELSRDQLNQYALELINHTRELRGLSILQWDDTGSKVAQELVSDLCKRNTVSHQNSVGENPDVRYSKAGGSDCLLESITCLKDTGSHLNKAIVAKLVNELFSHQDDRDSLLQPHATSAAIALDLSAAKDKVVMATEVVTKQAEVSALPVEARVGDKIDVKGTITGPYHFSKITLAWEGSLPAAADPDAEEQDEALPYFPPLDYAAFSKRSEHDYSKAIRVGAILGMGVAIAGGLFIPPVALAAPLIAASTATIKPKAVSDIPVRGGVKVDGNSFEDKIPLSKDSKEGIYYVTIWATSDADSSPFAVSRRAVIVRAADKLSPTDGINDGAPSEQIRVNPAQNNKDTNTNDSRQTNLLSASNKKQEKDEHR